MCGSWKLREQAVEVTVSRHDLLERIVGGYDLGEQFIELPVAFDKKLQPGYAWFPNGFGARYTKDHNAIGELQGANANELTDIADRDPFTGCPHHKAISVKISKIEASAAA